MDFSILIRAYNAEKFLKEAVDSILNQTCGCNIEVIILYHEGSTDRTWDVIEDLLKKTNPPPNISLKVIKHVHTTPFRSLQIGLKEAKGKYVTFLDYDNLYPPDYLEKIYNNIVEHPDATFLFSKAVIIDENGKVLSDLVKIPDDPYDVNKIISNNYIDGNTIILEKSCKEKIEEILSKLKHVYFDWILEDWLIATLGLKFCKPLHVKNAYIYYRVHGSNTIFGQIRGNDPKSLFISECHIKTLTAMLYIFDDRKLTYRVLKTLIARHVTLIRLTSEIAGVSFVNTLLTTFRIIIGYVGYNIIVSKFKKQKRG